MKEQDTRLGDLLVQFNFITEEQLDKALTYQRENRTNKRLGEILVDMDFIEENDLIQVLEFQLGVPHADLKKYRIDPLLSEVLPENVARRHMAVPLELKDNRLKVAMVDPSDIMALDDIRRATGYSVEPLIASTKDVKRVTSELYMGETRAEDVFQSLDEVEVVEETDYELDELHEMVEDAPIVRLANLIINKAIQERASDIHVEPLETKVKIRYRVDGMLSEELTSPKNTQAALISRLKIMANLDISERRKPQDGRINIKRGEVDWDMRVSTIPTIFGEKMVIRLLDRLSVPSIEDLGFSEKNEALFREVIKNPNGIILVTGPTGSGKSTTLFSSLKELNKPEVNITTVEDPIEYILPGINQIQANPKVDVTFANALRSILRQDPDIIMVGEIRDGETASIAVNAALTGHLVLSTLHTNDAATSVTRLIDMKVEPFLVSSTVKALMAQRLVRRVCSSCRQKVPLSDDEKKYLEKFQFPMEEQYLGKGCSRCNHTGYRGRMGIHEILVMDRDIRRLTTRNANSEKIKETAIEKGMDTLLMDGLQKAKSGYTTVEEVLRVATT